MLSLTAGLLLRGSVQQLGAYHHQSLACLPMGIAYLLISLQHLELNVCATARAKPHDRWNLILCHSSCKTAALAGDVWRHHPCIWNSLTPIMEHHMHATICIVHVVLESTDALAPKPYTYAARSCLGVVVSCTLLVGAL